ncbi:MAG: hypothetical protein M3044_19400 [Thermoproteota archaeon]|nr:hypothetical protein [Thermoproteota archaeon]
MSGVHEVGNRPNLLFINRTITGLYRGEVGEVGEEGGEGGEVCLGRKSLIVLMSGCKDGSKSYLTAHH